MQLWEATSVDVRPALEVSDLAWTRQPQELLLSLAPPPEVAPLYDMCQRYTSVRLQPDAPNRHSLPQEEMVLDASLFALAPVMVYNTLVARKSTCKFLPVFDVTEGVSTWQEECHDEIAARIGAPDTALLRAYQAKAEAQAELRDSVQKRKVLSATVADLQNQLTEQEEQQTLLEENIEDLTAREGELTEFLQDVIQRANVIIQEGMEG
ncbi:hypothetical protein HWV62_32569 [Athelia sp. TMB]|nr:hypothetical protein HWV62_32569 [Athelia sp. TMB]